MNQHLSLYDVACASLAELKTLDEVKEISDRAEAMRIYARRAKNRDLEIDAAEVRIRAERRVGELLIELKDAHRLNRGGRRQGGSRSSNKPGIASLSDLGIDKKLSMRGQRLAAQNATDFEVSIMRWRSRLAGTHQNVKPTLSRATRRDRKLVGVDGRPLRRLAFGSLDARIAAFEAEVKLLRAIRDRYQPPSMMTQIGDLLNDADIADLRRAIEAEDNI